MVGLFLATEARQIGDFLFQGWSDRWSLHRCSESVAFQSGIQIVILRGAVIDAKSRANNGLSVKCGRSPRQAHAGIEVLVIRIIQNRICRARRSVYGSDKRSVERTAPQAGAVKFIQIEDRSPVGRFVSHAIVFPAEPGSDRECWSHFPFILKVRHVESAAETVATPGGDKVEIRKSTGDHAQIVAKV